jgi:hypothetical protein
MSVEQGFSLWRGSRHAVVPYAAVRVGIDERGFDWNNKTVAQLGLKYVRWFSNGVAQVGAGYAHERRMASDFAAGQPIAFANYWFGWGAIEPGTRWRRPLLSLPGSSWGAVGNDAPAEGANVIAMLYVEQGVTAATIRDLAIIPFVELTISGDSAGRAWNNLRMFGEGLKLAVPIGRGMFEAAAIYKQERRWRDGSAAQGLAGFAHFRYGWGVATRR